MYFQGIRATFSTLRFTGGVCILVSGLAVLLGLAPAFGAPICYPSDSPPPTALNNERICSKPTAPPLPAVGGSYIDPTFGTTIFRVTGPTDGSSSGQALYSYLSPFNSKTTLFVVLLAFPSSPGTGIPYLYSFHPGASTPFTKVGPLWSSISLSAGIVWSKKTTLPRRLFSLDSTGKLYRADIGPAPNYTKTYTVLKDFAPLVCQSGGAGVTPFACNGIDLSTSADDRFFSFDLQDQTQGGAYVKSVVWDSVSDQTYAFDVRPSPLGSNFTYFDESRLDRSGRFLFLAGQPSPLSWEFATNTVRTLPFIGHYDVDFGSVVGVGVEETNPNAPGHRKFILDRSSPDFDVFYYPKKANPPGFDRQSWQIADHISILDKPNVSANPLYAFLGPYADLRLSGFELHSGSIYQRLNAQQVLPYANPPVAPDVVRHNGRDLVKKTSLAGITAAGQWFLDTTGTWTLYVWLYNDADPRVSGQVISSLDWFPAMDEIVQIWLDGTFRFRRLAHHRSGVWDYPSTPRGSISPNGKYFIYTSNWDGITNPDGTPRTDVFLLKMPSPLP